MGPMMGGLCSKGPTANDYVANNQNENEEEKEKEKELNQPLVQLTPPSKREEIVMREVNGGCDEFVQTRSKPVVQATTSSVTSTKDEEEKKMKIVERPTSGHHHHIRASTDEAVNGEKATMPQIISMPRGAGGEQIVAGWPSWLTSVPGEAIQGWVPRSADSFEKLNRIGQGTYSSVNKACDLKSAEIVAIKKGRFVMDPENVRFMAREIHILPKLDHPNVMKLESIFTSKMSGSLYLVFEYMEHDLAGLSASPKIKLTEPQSSSASPMMDDSKGRRVVFMCVIHFLDDFNSYNSLKESFRSRGEMMRTKNK